MSKKMHISWHDIELYLKEKIVKRELAEKKDHLINELNEMKKDLLLYKNDKRIYETELELYHDRIKKNKDVLEGLKMIFPEDQTLCLIILDLEKI